MSSTTTGRHKRLIVGGAVTGLALGLVPAHPATADEAAVPENIIVLISDGGGYNHFDAARLFTDGTSRHQVAVDPATGSVQRTADVRSEVFDDYPVQVGQSHFAANGRGSYSPELAWGDFDWVKSGATDSAAAATALGTGVKTRNGVIGFDAEDERLLTIGEQAQEVGKKVGLVTSVPFNHATPAGFIAHNGNRNDYHGLANEMIDSGVDVIIGGGHPNFTDANRSRPSHFGAGSWISQRDFERVSGGQTPFTYAESKSRFEQIAAGQDVPDKLFGLARVAQTLQYNRPGLANADVAPYSDPANTDVPTLETSAEAALKVLEKGDDGFFLMVEGGAVDWAGHANQTTRQLEEQLDFHRSIDAVDAWVEENSSWDETLVVVTADHETGYYAGPGAGGENGWTPMTGEKGELPEHSWHSGNHTNDLVPVYAKGAGSEVLQARADKWDFVRGAYLDNTDIGEAVFDFLGHAGTDSADSVGLEATVPLESAAGELSLAVVGAGSTVTFDGDARRQSADLPEVAVTDSRNEAQAQGKGWTVSGVAADFVAGNRTFDAANLSWIPRILDSESDAAAGGTASLGGPATLADADRETRVGTTTVGADLDLSIPSEARSGRYGSEITLTLFAKD